MGSPYAIEMLNITKRFPGIVANDDIDRCVQKLLAILTAVGCRRKYNDEILKEALSYVISPHV